MATEPLYGVTVKDVDQTLDYILAHHSSVARFGDGEIDLIAGRDIPYQAYDPALAEHLKRVLYTPSRPELVVCMSDVFERLERYTPAAQAFWAQNRPANAAIYQLMGPTWIGTAAPLFRGPTWIGRISAWPRATLRSCANSGLTGTF